MYRVLKQSFQRDHCHCKHCSTLYACERFDVLYIYTYINCTISNGNEQGVLCHVVQEGPSKTSFFTFVPAKPTNEKEHVSKFCFA